MTETEAGVMSGAEFKVQLGSLGLPPSWFAERMNVTMRTVVRWFDGESVSPRVVAELEILDEMTLETMQSMLEGTDDTDDVVLHTYRTDTEIGASGMPASWHRALTYRVMEHLRAQGKSVTVEYRNE